jgi:hypothetical protein
MRTIWTRRECLKSMCAAAAAGSSGLMAAMRYDFGGASFGIDGYMSRNRSSGLLILKGGAIALERYAMGNDAGLRAGPRSPSPSRSPPRWSAQR